MHIQPQQKFSAIKASLNMHISTYAHEKKRNKNKNIKL